MIPAQVLNRAGSRKGLGMRHVKATVVPITGNVFQYRKVTDALHYSMIVQLGVDLWICWCSLKCPWAASEHGHHCRRNLCDATSPRGREGGTAQVDLLRKVPSKQPTAVTEVFAVRWRRCGCLVLSSSPRPAAQSGVERLHVAGPSWQGNAWSVAATRSLHHQGCRPFGVAGGAARGDAVGLRPG